MIGVRQEGGTVVAGRLLEQHRGEQALHTHTRPMLSSAAWMTHFRWCDGYCTRCQAGPGTPVVERAAWCWKKGLVVAISQAELWPASCCSSAYESPAINCAVPNP